MGLFQCRVFYTLQIIIPPIILVISSFLTFLISKDKFIDRLKTLAALLIPTYVLQFTLFSILPRTFTLLAPHYLIFVSMVIMLILIIIAAISFVLVDRHNKFQWCASMACYLFDTSSSKPFVCNVCILFCSELQRYAVWIASMFYISLHHVRCVL